MNTKPGVNTISTRPYSYLQCMFWVLLFLLVARIIAMTWIPLNDTTEARYSEIARIMVETNNWITPMQQLNVPFLAKPPLSTWLSALSMKAFGVSALTARLPSLLLSVGVLMLVWSTARRHSGQLAAIVAVSVLAGSIGFYLDAGTIMTDPSLLFCTTLITLSFWQAVVGQKRLWGYGFFIGIGLGLLSKGPIALVLSGIPISLWIICQRGMIFHRWSKTWKRLPWVTGLILLCLIVVPWYYLAEMKNPGFLNYFIVGENFSRFFVPGWKGDKFGYAHSVPYGIAWFYAFWEALPWCAPAGVWLFLRRKSLSQLSNEHKDKDNWMRYLVFCALTPLVLFSVTHNILYAYVFPCLPPLALIFSEWTKRSKLRHPQIQRLILTASLSGFVLLIGTGLFVFYPERVEKSQDRVVALFMAQHPTKDSRLIYWAKTTEFSAQFYSHDKALSTLSSRKLCRLLSNNTKNYVVLSSKKFNPPLPTFPKSILVKMNEMGKIRTGTEEYRIFEADNSSCHS